MDYASSNQWHTFRCRRFGSVGFTQGFFATTLPFSQTYRGVPYMRAVFCASFAARRKARPTPVAKLGGRLTFVRVFAFMDLSPVAVVYGPNYRTPPSYPPTGDRCAENSPSLLRTVE